uniref:hypothetical protein n=1 Tax=Nonomuraea bangladeshensis TaxID=404385 RepID=UPI003F498376
MLWGALAQQWYRGAPVAATVRAAAAVRAAPTPRQPATATGGRRAWHRVRLPLSGWFLILAVLAGAAGASLLA